MSRNQLQLKQFITVFYKYYNRATFVSRVSHAFDRGSPDDDGDRHVNRNRQTDTAAVKARFAGGHARGRVAVVGRGRRHRGGQRVPGTRVLRPRRPADDHVCDAGIRGRRRSRSSRRTGDDGRNVAGRRRTPRYAAIMSFSRDKREPKGNVFI